MEINKYKPINVQTVQSQVLDSVENDKTHEETQGQANNESREASGPGFAVPDPSTGPEAPREEILPIPIWNPFENKPINECISNIRWDSLSVAKLILKIRVSLSLKLCILKSFQLIMK